ncbi:hypothetical protein B0H17DRAFT_1215017 [Mycena rosella]|uniref:Uncharacterized protein n=1 Tax=Mycena rosella TaxID=1033263 RepID=A0AAD7G3S9_MYCRO|nr:hypothetical protein B0H17DRAFT_1215017 [Mycena rosella]
MLKNCRNFTIAGGTFNVWEQPRSPPSDFRSVQLGDLNLLTQMGKEEALTSDVVERRGPGLVQRKAIVGTRKVYRARIFGSQDPMMAVVYEGSQFEKWKAEAERHQSVRYGHPFINSAAYNYTPRSLPFVLQLFGVTESRGVNALIYYDELITITQFRQLHRGSLLVSEYIEYQMARDGAIEFDIDPWTTCFASIDIVSLDTGWARITVPAAVRTDLNFISHNAIYNTSYMYKSWISQAPRLLESEIATGVKLDDLILIDTVYLSMRLHYPAQNMDLPSNMPYLIVFDPAARNEEDGTVWMIFNPQINDITGLSIPQERKSWESISLPSSPFPQ